MKRILLLSAYDSASHRYWREGMQKAHPEYDWVVKCQSARHFSWRVRASGWQWALGDDPDFKQAYDLVIATSICNVLPLFARCPALRDTPLWIYFHENQFAHPLADNDAETETSRSGWQFQSIQNALCADQISFNSAFNRKTFLDGADRLLSRTPELLPGDPVKQIGLRSDVLPVPLTTEFLDFRNQSKMPGLIVWNHRWEWDKQPERFLRALSRLRNDGIPFQLAMMGSGGGKNDNLVTWKRQLSDRLVHWGEADSQTYRDWLQRADIGVSTACHDFQGLAMLEVAQAGATAVVPHRVAYPEVLPDAIFYEGSEKDTDHDVDSLYQTLKEQLTSRSTSSGKDNRHQSNPPPSWSDLGFQYRSKISNLIERGGNVVHSEGNGRLA